MAEQPMLAGRVAIVTGAANGMGRVMARALAAAGAKVAGVDLDAAGLDRLGGEPTLIGKLLAVAADVSKTDDCRRAVAQAAETLGAPDILVNCAGISMSTAAGHRQARIKFLEADPEAWQRIFAINCIGAFLMARFAAEPMVQRGWGRIINVTTSFDTMLAAGLSAYGASKAALEAGSVSFAKDLEGTGVTVNILVPGGPTDTPGFSARQTPPACPARPRDHERPGRMARIAAIRRHYRVSFYRARLGQAAAGGRSGRRGAGAGGMARPCAGRGVGARPCHVGQVATIG